MNIQKNTGRLLILSSDELAPVVPTQTKQACNVVFLDIAKETPFLFI